MRNPPRTAHQTLSDKSFDALHGVKSPTVREIDRIAGLKPSRWNAQRVRDLAAMHERYAPVVAFMDSILTGKARKDWRYSFGGYAIGPAGSFASSMSRISATSGAFSLIRQAIHYGE